MVNYSNTYQVTQNTFLLTWVTTAILFLHVHVANEIPKGECRGFQASRRQSFSIYINVF